VSKSAPHSWLHRYARLTALATLGLLGLGGLVTSHGAGMAVPDWPTTYGYNMFLFPIGQWVGGIFYEHTHRLVASAVGLLVVGLTRWLGGARARRPLLVAGLAEILAGCLLLALGPSWKGTGYFLAGIGGVLLLGAAVWARNPPAPAPLPALGWLALAAVQVQGLLGGLRVVLFKDEIGIFHAALAQLFFVLLCLIALRTSGWWQILVVEGGFGAPDVSPAPDRSAARLTDPRATSVSSRLSLGVAFTTALIFAQLLLGATMRHQHAGLAIPDFPLAYGKIWPAMDTASVAHYNQQRLEVTALNPITGTQIGLQMAHRLLALGILGGVALCAWSARRTFQPQNPVRNLTLCWLLLILTQVLFGAGTIWSNKAADLATAHLVVGGLSLALGAILTFMGAPGLGSLGRAAAAGFAAPQITPGTAFGSQAPTAASLK
jgi:cytochrome c oxidase assembly protein subunit 15